MPTETVITAYRYCRCLRHFRGRPRLGRTSDPQVQLTDLDEPRRPSRRCFDRHHPKGVDVAVILGD
jgi:hypothetical protein